MYTITNDGCYNCNQACLTDCHCKCNQHKNILKYSLIDVSKI